jgi:ABC-type spermidine/putrescine transport system permease subunit I
VGAQGASRSPVYTLENYQQLFNACTPEFSGPDCDPFLYIGIFWHSVRIALVVTFWCIVLGYPLSYFISRQKPTLAGRIDDPGHYPVLDKLSRRTTHSNKCLPQKDC